MPNEEGKVEVGSLIDDVVQGMAKGKSSAPPVTPAPAAKVDEGTPKLEEKKGAPAPIPLVPDSLFGKKPEEKPATVLDSALPTDADISKLHPGAQNAAKAMRARIEAQNVELAELRKKTATPQNTADIEALKKQNEELEGSLSKIALEQSPRFRERFEKPKREAVTNIEKLMLAGEKDPDRIKELKDVITQAMTLPVNERAELIGEHAEKLASLILPEFDKIDKIEADRAGELSKSKDALTRDEQIRQQEIKQFKATTFKDIYTKAIAAGHFVFTPIPDGDPGAAEWNAMVASVTNTAQQLFDSDDPQVQAAGLLLGASAPVYKDLYMREREARLAAEATVKQYQGAMPRIGGGQTPSIPDGKTPPADGRMSARQAADDILGRILPTG